MKPALTTRAQGDLGEDAVVRYLRRRGWQILERNFTVKGGEIDIIARRLSYIVFVEVKTRRITTNTDKYGHAQDAVDKDKRAHLRYAASRYLATHPTKCKPRFDIAEVYYHPEKAHSYRVIYRKEAF